MTFSHALSTNNYGTAKFIVSSSAANGTHTTIASALTSASSGDTIFIRTGTYTENLTLKAGVNLTAFTGDAPNTVNVTTFNVKIIGKLSASFTGNCSISNICLQTNGDYCLEISGGNVTRVVLDDCFINALGTSAIHCTGASAKTVLHGCQGELDATASYFTISAGTLTINYGGYSNTGASTTASTLSGGNLEATTSVFVFPISTSGNAVIGTSYCNLLGVITLTGTSTFSDNFSYISGGTSSAVSIGAGCTAYFYGTNISSSNTNAITGAGTVTLSGCLFSSTSHTVNTTTQSLSFYIPGAMNTSLPAGDYTVLSTDSWIGATSSAARAITLPASPVAGQQHIVKDITGSAAANNITVSGNGHNILGTASAATFVINVNYGSATFIYTGTVWAVV